MKRLRLNKEGRREGIIEGRKDTHRIKKEELEAKWTGNSIRFVVHGREFWVNRRGFGRN